MSLCAQLWAHDKFQCPALLPCGAAAPSMAVHTLQKTLQGQGCTDTPQFEMEIRLLQLTKSHLCFRFRFSSAQPIRSSPPCIAVCPTRLAACSSSSTARLFVLTVFFCGSFLSPEGVRRHGGHARASHGRRSSRSPNNTRLISE